MIRQLIPILPVASATLFGAAMVSIFVTAKGEDTRTEYVAVSPTPISTATPIGLPAATPVIIGEEAIPTLTLVPTEVPPEPLPEEPVPTLASGTTVAPPVATSAPIPPPATPAPVPPCPTHGGGNNIGKHLGEVKKC